MTKIERFIPSRPIREYFDYQKYGIPFSASGGAMTLSGGYIIHSFTSTGSNNFIVNSGSKNIEILIVAGGGGGGSDLGGGGGAGGYFSGNRSIVSGTYSMTVGTNGGSNAKGSDSVFLGITMPGGGAGNGSTAALRDGGSGAGVHATNTPGVATAAANGGIGNNGAGGISTGGGGSSSGGGGGAGSAGGAGSNSVGGNGGAGLSNSITGSALFYAGGGGGATWGGTGGTGGSGIGGNGAASGVGTSASPANRGSGGGGGSSANPGGGSGSTGIIIVRYLV